MGINVVLYSGFYIRKPKNIMIGDGTVIGFNCELDGRKGISIGKNVNVSSDVKIYTLQHDYMDVEFKAVGGEVVVEDYVWLSVRCIILPGVRVGKGAVVAANALVTKDVEPFTVVGGIPAKEIGRRNNNLNYRPSKSKLYFN